MAKENRLVMILSGEDVNERHRSRRAIELYKGFNGDAQILISGSHSGFLGRELPKGMIRECHQVAAYLLSQGIPREIVRCEEKSVDTLGNFYFSRPLIDEDQRQIHLVTDKFHMGRSIWCSSTQST